MEQLEKYKYLRTIIINQENKMEEEINTRNELTGRKVEAKKEKIP